MLLVESGSMGGFPKAASKSKLQNSPRQEPTKVLRVSSFGGFGFNYLTRLSPRF